MQDLIDYDGLRCLVFLYIEGVIESNLTMYFSNDYD
jgi:hypothetical protein